MEKKKVLICEDEEFIAFVYKEKFPADTYETIIAGDGEEAIKLLGKENFVLVLLDLMMPKKSGWDVLEFIKSNKITTPVVVLSNLAQAADKEKALGLGATDYLVKSDMGINDLMEKVTGYIK